MFVTSVVTVPMVSVTVLAVVRSVLAVMMTSMV